MIDKCKQWLGSCEIDTFQPWIDWLTRKADWRAKDVSWTRNLTRGLYSESQKSQLISQSLTSADNDWTHEFDTFQPWKDWRNLTKGLYSVQWVPTRGEQIIWYSNTIRITNIRIRIRPQIETRILFVFVQKFGSVYYSYSYSSKNLGPNIIRIRIRLFWKYEYYSLQYSADYV